MSLKRKLLITISLMLLSIAVVLGALSLNRMSAQVLDSVAQSNLNYSNSTANMIAHLFKTKRDTISSLGKSIAETSKHDEILNYLKQAKRSVEFDLTYYGMTDGNMYRSSGYNTVKGYDPRKRGWYKLALSEDDVITTEPFIAASTGKLTVTVAQKISGINSGVVGASVNLESINQNILNMEVPGDGYAFIVSNKGTIVSHPDEKLHNKNFSEMNTDFTLAKLNQAVQNKQLVDVEIDNINYLLSAVSIEGIPWKIVLVGQKDVMLKPIDRLFTFIIIATVLLVTLALAVTVALVRYLLVNLENVSDALAEISQGGGDLTQRINITSNDEVGTLAINFNLFVQQLQRMLLDIETSTHELNSQAGTASESASSRSSQAQTQQDEVTLVATAVTEMAMATKEIASNAEQTSLAADNTVGISDSGKMLSFTCKDSITELANQVNKASDIISEVDQNSQKINSIVETIRGIAEQTNLLALNAAIEAARAGDQGRGFAVVADEVRVLSQRTHDSTEEISAMITTFQRTTGAAVETMSSCHTLANTSVNDVTNSTQSFEDIAIAIREISDMSAQIATAAEQQTQVTDEINRNTECIRDVSEEFLNESEAGAQQAMQLKELAKGMNELLNKFKLC